MHARKAPDSLRCREYPSSGGGVSRCSSMMRPCRATSDVSLRARPKSYTGGGSESPSSTPPTPSSVRIIVSAASAEKGLPTCSAAATCASFISGASSPVRKPSSLLLLRTVSASPHAQATTITK